MKDGAASHYGCGTGCRRDVNSTMACALVAKKLHVTVIHVEAGLRTGDLNRPFPEEFNRWVGKIAPEFRLPMCPPKAESRARLLGVLNELGLLSAARI